MVGGFVSLVQRGERTLPRLKVSLSLMFFVCLCLCEAIEMREYLPTTLVPLEMETMRV